jgi:hypothetical protein
VNRLLDLYHFRVHTFVEREAVRLAMKAPIITKNDP